jgi:hypothetical protein
MSHQKRQVERPRHRGAALFLAMFVDPPLFCEVFKKLPSRQAICYCVTLIHEINGYGGR